MSEKTKTGRPEDPEARLRSDLEIPKPKPLSRTRDERIADQIRKHLAATLPLCEELVFRGYSLVPNFIDISNGGAPIEVVSNYNMTCEKEL